ncbi:TIGR03089 family protein [Blastococcus sp. CT_GayMR16]|uniref:TIGR03089 family protein n=1 Tax=Blastococcus sp. CT_GayMR16 TaxID=2559607 RepID=UPI0010731461|nr:TIGR03089 family protein [Blastococcus sp. CT_GayMR16]TFV87779.1 TIGR03089 family protein [Blastococcus sp. CT_GayMR16]
MPPIGPAALLAAARDRDPGRPLVTHYDDSTGERVELSATTLDNWVAKTANLLQDEFDVGPGSTVAVALPVHWQTAAVLLGIWSCGAAVLDTAAEDDGGLTGADVVLASQDRLAALEEEDGDAERLGLSLHPLGAGMVGYAGPARDFALEVRTSGDRFVPYAPPEAGAPGLIAGGLELSLGGLVETALELAGRLGIGPDDRVLVDAQVAAEAGPVAWLLAPLAAGASIVLCRYPIAERLPERAAAERVTATLGRNVDGVRELGRTAEEE